MEKYVSTCRLLLICTNPSKVIAPIRSRCMCLRVAAPTHDEICTVLGSIAQKEGLKLPAGLAMRIAAASERNLRRAILTLEACKVAQYPFTDNQPLQQPDWLAYIDAVALDVLHEQSPRQLLKVRGRLYELISSCIPPDLIFQQLTIALLKRCPKPVQHEALHHAAIYEHRLQAGEKAVFHLEAFLARFMSVYKKHMVMSQR